MNAQTHPADHNDRVVKTLPFVEALARRMAATMPHSIDIGDLVQDGRAIADAKAQATAIGDDLASTGGPAGLQDKEIVALVAYLQRLGTDIRKAGSVAQRSPLLGGF